KTVMASLGPMPLMVRSFSKRRFSWVSEKPKRAIWSSDVSVDVQVDFGAFAGKRGEGGYADRDVVAHAGALDDGLVRGFGEDASSEVSNHAWLIVACWFGE